MKTRGPTAQFTLYLALLLAAGMGSIHLVMMVTLQKMQVSEEKRHARVVLSSLCTFIIEDTDRNQHSLEAEKWRITRHLASIWYGDRPPEVMVMDGDGRIRYQNLAVVDPDHPLARIAARSLKTGALEKETTGSFLGFMWGHPATLLLAEPVDLDTGPGVAAITIDLSDAVRQLKKIQHLHLVYIAVNTLLLSLVGLYLFYRTSVRPVQRLVKRAESYQDDSELFFTAVETRTDVNRLSGALNAMLRRISADKVKMQAHLESLEKANAELRQAHRKILMAEKMASVGRLSAGIAHEIGNPIGIVAGYFELIKDSDCPESERIDYIRRAEGEINRISEIIRRLLDFSRPSLEEPRAVYVHEVIKDVTQMVEPQPFSKSLDIEYRLGADNDCVMADANQLRQVFLNLVLNAVDAIAQADPSEGGRLIIKTENTLAGAGESETAERIRICFTDNGAGIPPDQQDLIFDPFFTTKAPGQGTGLGLAVCFSIVEGLDGAMTVESPASAGASLCLDLPAAPTQVAENKGDPAHE